MKLMKRIAVGLASLLLLTSCSILQKAASATSLGGNTGSAISAIYNVLKAAGGIDLSNLTNIINIGKILTGAGALSNATQAFTVNNGNVAKVLSGLKALNNIDTSAFSESATKAYANGTQQIQQNDANVNATVKAITSLLGAL